MMNGVLTLPKTVAIIGLSNSPDRPSYQVGLYLKTHGFTIVPVNPMVSEVFGLKAYPSILHIPKNIHIDIIDVFRKPDQVIPVLNDVVASGRKPLIWLQEGVGTPEAEAYAKQNGMEVVMNVCMMKEHKKAVL